MACGLSALQIGKIINEYVAGNNNLSSRQGLQLALKTYEYKEDGIFKKLTKDERQEIVDNYYPQYINAFNAAHSKINKQNSITTQKQYRRYVKSKKMASMINNGDIAAYFKSKVEEAYQFKGEKRERMLQQLNAEISSLENPAWQNLVNDWIWIRPLISVKFILSSLIANGMSSIERSLISRIRKNKAVKNALQAHRHVMNSSVLAGGLPASSSIKLLEGGRGSVSEFNISEASNVDYANNKILNSYYNMGSFFTKWGGRLINWTDTNVGYHSELLYYSMLTKKETDIFKNTHNITTLSQADKAEISRIVTTKMFGKANLVEARKDATAAVTDMYRNAGYTIEDNTGVNDNDLKIGSESPEFLRSVYEHMTETKDLDVLQAANRLAARDFFKGNMNRMNATTRIEKFDAGVLGILSYPGFATQKIFANMFGTGIVADKLSQMAVGFLNGASHFAENLLENTPYGFIKGAIMSGIPATSLSEQLYKNQRTNDLLLKPVINMTITAAMYGLAKFAEAEFCDKNKGQSVSNEDISNAKVMTICGWKVPAWMTGMSAANVIAMNYFINVANDKQQPSVADIVAMAYALGNVREEQQGQILLFVKNQLSAGKASKAQEKNLISTIAGQLVDAALSPFLMFPNRPINEVITTLHQGKESSPSFKFQGEGIVPEFKNIPAYAKWATYQTLGIKEYMMAFTGNTAGTKFYDYRGREVANTSASNNMTDWGIRYDKADDLMNKLDISPRFIHNSPYRVLYDTETTPTHDLRRFMTELEYQNVQRAIGVKFNEFINDHYDELNNLDPKEAQKKIENALSDTERQSKSAVEDTPGASYEVYLSKIHIDANPRKVKHKKTHNF